MKKQSKLKTYVLMLSTVFPKRHPKAGEPTHFPVLFRKKKIHTIRANYPLWEKRFKQVDAGNAVISVRMWLGKPYKSKQQEIAQLRNTDGIGIQRLDFVKGYLFSPQVDAQEGYARSIDVVQLAKNDGLDKDEWAAWFNDYDLTKPMAIIHFTNFRY